MRVASLACLVMVAATSFACWGGEVSPPDVATKVVQVGVLCPTENGEARLSYNNALQLQQQGMRREAKTSYLKAIELDPGYCDAMDNLGLMFRSEGDVEQAISWYKRSLAVNPVNAVARQNLAAAYVVLGDYDKAIAEFKWLTQNDPKNPEGYYGLGNVYLTSGNTQAAIGPLMRAEELYKADSSPLLADAQYNLGVAFYMLEDYRKSRDYLQLVYPGRENNPTINYLLGACYLDPSIRDMAKGRQYLLKARELGMKLPDDVIRELEK